jgi:hypothetical protein
MENEQVEKETEDNQTTKVRKAFTKYREKAEKTIESLEQERDHLIIELAFYLFEIRLIRNTLSKDIKAIFNSNNKNNKRIFNIINAREEFLNGKLEEESFPLEIKKMIKELIL